MNDDEKTPLEGEETTISKEDHNKVVEEVANLTQDKSNLVEEVKKIRQRAQDAEAKAKELEVSQKPEVTPEGGTPGIDELTRVANEAIDKRLSERAVEDAKGNRQKALDKFKAERKEFLEANDPAGLKWSALEDKVGRFTTAGVQSEEDFTSILNDAYKLLGGDTPAPREGEEQAPIEPGAGDTIPAEVDNTVLNSKELKIVRDTYNGDKEAFLKIKAKRPDYVARLLEHMI